MVAEKKLPRKGRQETKAAVSVSGRETSVLQTPVSDWSNEEVYQNLETLTIKEWKVWLPKLMACPQVTAEQLLRATKRPNMTLPLVYALEENIMKFF